MKVAVPLPKHSPILGQAGLFAHRVELVLAQDLLDLVKTRARAARLDANPLGLLEQLALHHLDRNARQLGRRLLLGQRVVVFLALDIANNRIDSFRGAHGVLLWRYVVRASGR